MINLIKFIIIKNVDDCSSLLRRDINVIYIQRKNIYTPYLRFVCSSLKL